MPTRILVVGRGGREHALAWKLAGEPGINSVAVLGGGYTFERQGFVGVAGSVDNSDSIVAAARHLSAELVVVGPEAALAAGVADALAQARIACFGPTLAAARIETSKAFCRDVATAAGVPMARGRAFVGQDAAAAKRFAASLAAEGSGVVVKADGLAAGKGVTVCDTGEEAARAIDTLDEPFVVEQRLRGREASVIAICDGRDAIALPNARDHKRLHDGDQGPNTGGMGAYSPVPDLPDVDAIEVIERFHRPVLAELAHRGTPFRGALYAGLMLTDDGPRLLEFNARLGDPETQVVLPRLAVALGPWLLAAARGAFGAGARSLPDREPRLRALPGATVGIVLAAAGYPGVVAGDGRITALDDDGRLPDAADVLVFHSGTVHETGNLYRATGGRVLTVVGRGADLDAARAAAEAAADRIAWSGMQRRHDIAAATTAGVAVGAGT
ncbi:MAG TPA: phosphoribosylamine--glycine ligase [Candidatus Limnocylindrales bacterium]|nr:phosphoribosylamine--glycine ligase [Candidatus Limnocylindrales bacterium]